MSFLDLALKRYSVRAYKPDPVRGCLQAGVGGRLAPTAANRQPFRLIVIRTQGRKRELADLRTRLARAGTLGDRHLRDAR